MDTHETPRTAGWYRRDGATFWGIGLSTLDDWIVKGHVRLPLPRRDPGGLLEIDPYQAQLDRQEHELRGDLPRIDRLAEDRQPSLDEEWGEAAPDWIMTLGDEPVGVLGLEDLRLGEYGVPRRAKMFGRDVWHLALVHTRQAGGHGAHSADWRRRHLEWADARQRNPMRLG